jgi:hypothetical protein
MINGTMMQSTVLTGLLMGLGCNGVSQQPSPLSSREAGIGSAVTDLVKISEYDKSGCVKSGNCAPVDERYLQTHTGVALRQLGLAFVTIQDARKFCAERGMEVPTPAESDRMANRPRGTAPLPLTPLECTGPLSIPCLTQESYASVSSIGVPAQWSYDEGYPDGVLFSFDFADGRFEGRPAKPNDHGRFRCVRPVDPTIDAGSERNGPM